MTGLFQSHGRDWIPPFLSAGIDGVALGLDAIGPIFWGINCSGCNMDVTAAIGTLQELVGRGTTVNLFGEVPDSGPPFVVAHLDFLAGRESRCIVSRTDQLGIYRSLRRAVVEITRERRYHEADTVLAAAALPELRLAVEQSLL